MAANVERSDSQRSQSNGPRVSFNKDVHVKRIGLRPNELPNSIRRELPKDLSKEGILKEAALVLSQAEKAKCTIENGSEKSNTRLSGPKSRPPVERKKKSLEDSPDKFHSLPTRKKKRNPVNRSSSDASTKKYKRPSIFNIFSRKSEPNLSDTSDQSQPKKLIRAKSDVSDLKGLKLKRAITNDPDDSIINSKRKNQLSPIIENSSSEKIFDRVNSKPVAVESKIVKPRKQWKIPEKVILGTGSLPPGNIGFTNEKDLDLIPTKPHFERTTIPVNANQIEGVHSSQLPPKKPPLTKGLTVDGMVKRLSMERFSPPPAQLHGPVFSYTRPNDYIVYARVAYDNDGKAKQTVHSRFSKSDSSQTEDVNGVDTVDSPRKIDDTSHSNIILYKNIENHQRSLSPVQHLKRSPLRYEQEISMYDKSHRFSKGNSDEDEGVGLESKQDIDEPPIVPIITSHRTSGITFTSPIETEFNKLSNRRKLLESRMETRKFGTLERPSNKNKSSSPSEPYRSTNRHDTSPTYIVEREESYPRQYRREMSIGVDGIPTTKDFQIRNRLNSPSRCREIDLGYIEDNYDYQNSRRVKHETNYIPEKYRQEFEPKSLDLDQNLSRSVPESYMDKVHHQYYRDYPDNYQASIKRDKRKQRYLMDKGDSGIENDFRKESHGDDSRVRWKYRTFYNDMEDTDLFLKRERQHSEQLHMKRYNYIFRERSIDDGSHFDPRLDKYPRRSERSVERNRTEEKKIGGLEKVKQLFTSPLKKKSEVKKVQSERNKHMVREEEMRTRYKEHRGSEIDSGPQKLTEISLRRRLSTPKASPIPKRTPSQKSSKSSNVSVQTDKPQKSGWFKSLDRLSRKKSQNSSKSDSIVTTEYEPSTLKSISRHSSSRNAINRDSTEKNLRFFGDTDVESSANYRGTSVPSKRTIKPILNPSLSRHQKYSQSDHSLSSIPTQAHSSTVSAKYRSTSLHNLQKDHEDSNRDSDRHISRSSTHFHEVTESDARDIRNGRPHAAPRTEKYRHYANITTSRLNNANDRNYSQSYDVGQDRTDFVHQVQERGRPRERSPWTPSNYHYDRADSESRKPPAAPQKPARTLNRRRVASNREQDRVHDSSGTECDSSQQSQRSVVYLHATTVGTIPQAYAINGQRTVSKDDISTRSKATQPMTRTVARSFSVTAPWKPKHRSEGYEINYTPASELKPPLVKPTKKDRTSTLIRNRKLSSKDDLHSIRNSSLTSNSSSVAMPYHDRDPKKSTLTRHRR